jgi:glycosyltransferase involved in cell wall biosynthesis
VVIVVCPSLQATVREVEPSARTVLIENAPGLPGLSGWPGWDAGPRTIEKAARLRQTIGVPPASPLVLYTGTFEAYQGLDLLFAAMSIVRRSRPDARLVLAGGRPEQLARAGAQTRSLGIDDVTIFVGERPAVEIPVFLQTADLLVSPRSRGTNTPLKVYQYLGSGKPIVATRLLTHTQVLNDETAILTGATPKEFANGMLEGLADPARAAALGQRAQALAGAKYSYEAYLQKTREACAVLAPGPPPGEAVKDPA